MTLSHPAQLPLSSSTLNTSSDSRWSIDATHHHVDDVYALACHEEMPVVYVTRNFGVHAITHDDGTRLLEAQVLWLKISYRGDIFFESSRVKRQMRIEVSIMYGCKELESFEGPWCHPEDSITRAHKRALFHTRTWIKHALTLAP